MMRKELNKMEKRMTWKEIQEAYPDQWVGLSEVEWIEKSSNVRSAIVKYTDKTRDEISELHVVAGEDVYAFHTNGEEHVVYIDDPLPFGALAFPENFYAPL